MIAFFWGRKATWEYPTAQVWKNLSIDQQSMIEMLAMWPHYITAHKYLMWTNN